MKTHHLKTWPEYFEAVKSGVKPFEFRRNDRNFEVGDILVLQAFDPNGIGYTDEKFTVEVTYILHGTGKFGLTEGYCIMSIKPTT